jgi:hypothetical protein
MMHMIAIQSIKNVYFIYFKFLLKSTIKRFSKGIETIFNKAIESFSLNFSNFDAKSKISYTAIQNPADLGISLTPSITRRKRDSSYLTFITNNTNFAAFFNNDSVNQLITSGKNLP